MTHPSCTHRLSSILVALFVWNLCVVPSVRAQELLPPSRQAVYGDAFTGEFVMPKWQNGHLVRWRHETRYTNPAENLILYDRDARAVGKARVWLEGATFVFIVDAAVRPDGRVVVVGQAIGGSGEVESYVAEVSLAAAAVRVVQTSPFDGRAVTVAPDGTIWVLGLQPGGPGRSELKAPDHYVIERFGTDYHLTGQYLLRSQFPCKVHPAQSVGGVVQILASADRIGFYSPSCRMWTELSLDGKLLGQWKWDDGPVDSTGHGSTSIRVVRITSTNELYARMDLKRDGARLARFDRKSSTWVPVGTSAADEAGVPFMTLLGGEDDDSLVYLAPGKTLVWAKPQSTP